MRIDAPVLKDGAVSFQLVFAPPGVAPLDPIPITVRQGTDVVQQITAQLAGQANRLNALFNAYAESVLKHEAEDWARNQARFSEQALRAALAQGISLFGMQLRVTDIRPEAGRLSITVQSTGGGVPTFSVKNIRIAELDAGGRPLLSGSALEHATIEGDFSSWIEKSFGASDYMQLRITNASFAPDGGLMLSSTVLIPVLGDPFAIQIGPISNGNVPIDLGDVRGKLLAKALSEANARCKNCSLEAGSLVIAISGFKSSGDQILVDGNFSSEISSTGPPKSPYTRR